MKKIAFPIRSFLSALTLTLPLAFALTLPLTLQAQPVFADLHCHSLLKPFYSGMDDPWAFWEHKCAPDAYGVVLEKAADIPKFTQGNFESMHLGNTRPCLCLPLAAGI